jgi:hypothetical protein
MRDHRHDRRSANLLKLEGELLEESEREARKFTDIIHQMFNIQTFISDPRGTVWLCAHCMDLPQEKECYDLGKIKSHLLTTYVLLLFILSCMELLFVDISHSVGEPVENQDYYKDFEVPQGRRQDSKFSHHTVTLEMERPPNVSPPGLSFLGFDDDEDDDEEAGFYYDDDDDDEDDGDEEDDFYFGNPLFPFY